MKKLFWPICILGLVALVTAFAFSLKNAQGDDFTAKVGIDQKLDAQLPLDLPFKDEDGTDVKLANYFKDKPVVLLFVFYNCKGTCTLELNGAAKLFNDIKYEDVGKNFDVVTVSIHPKEGPELAKGKKESYLTLYTRPSAQTGWHFLTGSQDSITKLTKAVGYHYTYEPAKDRIVHPTGLIVCTPQGKVSRYFYGVDFPAKVVLNSIHDASKGQVGVWAQVVDFNCFQVDAATGKVKLNVMNALKVSGLATVLILATSIFIMTKRDRVTAIREESESV